MEMESMPPNGRRVVVQVRRIMPHGTTYLITVAARMVAVVARMSPMAAMMAVVAVVTVMTMFAVVASVASVTSVTSVAAPLRAGWCRGYAHCPYSHDGAQQQFLKHLLSPSARSN